MITSAALVVITRSLRLYWDFSAPMQKLWLSGVIVGFIVVAMWSFNLMSYKGGAHIAIKKLVMNGSYLIMAMMLGIIIFGEAITAGKILGVILYLIALAFMDKNTWEYLTNFKSSS